MIYLISKPKHVITGHPGDVGEVQVGGWGLQWTDLACLEHHDGNTRAGPKYEKVYHALDKVS